MHKTHKYVKTDEFIRTDKYNLKTILEDVMDEFIKGGKRGKDLKRLLIMKVEKMMDIREEDILEPIMKALSEDRHFVNESF